ncbi:MAG: hypothetical protein U5M50_16280 [Sphingobium sp.]|nr:hypothetical protein [Sphingobium sp.]
MLQKNWGRVLFIAGESGLLPPAEMIHYGMTKSAQLSISRMVLPNKHGERVSRSTVYCPDRPVRRIVDFIRSVVEHKDAPEAEREVEFFTKLRPLSLVRADPGSRRSRRDGRLSHRPLAAATNGAALRVEGGIIPTIA